MTNLQWQFIDCNSNLLSNTKVLFTPTKSPEITSSFLSVADSYQFTTNGSGYITASIVPSTYKVEVVNPKPSSTFYLTVNETGSNLTSGSVKGGTSKSVYFDLINLVKEDLAVKKVTLTPTVNYPFVWSGSLAMLSATSSKTNTTGDVTFGALLPGVYQVDCFGKVTTTFFISVPSSGSASWNAKDLLVVKPAKATPVKLTNLDNSMVLTVSSSDARYIPKGGAIDSASYATLALTASYAANGSGGPTVSASYAQSASVVMEPSTGTGAIVRQVSPVLSYGDEAIRVYGQGLEIFSFNGDEQILNTDNTVLTVVAPMVLNGGSINPNTVLTVDSANQVVSSGITTTQLNDLPNKYSSGSAMSASGLVSSANISVKASQPDSVVEWPSTNSQSYGRFIFKQGSTEYGTLQVLGSGFDQFYSTSGRSNAMEFYNNYGPIIFFNRGSEKFRVAASGSIIVGRPGVTASLYNLLDVNGNVLCNNITASLLNGTASYANQATSASWAPSTGGSGTTLFTGSLYQVTASRSVTASYSAQALSASYAPSLGGGTTLFTASLYQITASKAVNSTSASYADKAGIAVNLNSTFEAFNDGTNFYIQNYGEAGNESRINYDNVAVQYNFYVPVNIPTVNGNIAGTKANMSQVTSSAIKTGRWTHYEDASNNLIFKYV